MTAKHGNSTLLSGSGTLVDGLALSVISRVNAAPHLRRNRRIDVGTKILIAAALDSKPFDPEVIQSDLASMRIAATDIVDHCIPLAARELGQAWVEDRLSWAQVTVGSARLYNLCKSVGMSWDNVRPPMNARTLLLTTIEREDHIIGPAVLTDQLRRRGHSVRLHSNGTAETIVQKMRAGRFDGLLISISTTQALETAIRVIRDIRKAGTGIPIVLGGAVLSLKGQSVTHTGADLVTDDIEEALDALTGDDISLRVAE